MCGLTGYWNLERTKGRELKIVREMAKLQEHRGPDDLCLTGIDTTNYNIEQVVDDRKLMSNPCDLFFGFNRLSILDLSDNGRQPMFEDSKNVVLMMNGEIYNAFEYSEPLKEKGYKFKSKTDTEVVLALYLEYGINMLKKLNGMFAIVIWDARYKKLFLARDRFGIKPLYYSFCNKRFVFSSEIKSFKALPDFRFELDRKKLDEFLLFRNVINDTLFDNINNLEPGTFLSINNEGLQEKRKFYSVDEECHNKIINGQAAHELESSLKESVQRQMISDVKLGCQLSGGVDSSLVTYFASRYLKKGALETISIKFENPAYSEEHYIDLVSDKLNLTAHKFNMDPSYYFENLENVSWHFEQPINHPNTIGIYLLSQKAKNYVTVLLSGEGADEILSGYNRFVMAQENPYLNRSFLRNFVDNCSHVPSFLSYYSDPVDRYIMSSSFMNLNVIHDLYPEFSLGKALDKRRKIFDDLSGSKELKLRKYEILTYLPDLLMRQDKMSMAHSIENRVPFLDNEMVKTSLSICDSELVKKRSGKKEGKLTLKDICSEKFDKSFAFRNKKGFGIPLREFVVSSVFQTRWSNEIEPAIRERGIFNVNKVSSWVGNAKNASSAQLDGIWLMTGFEIWASQYLDG